MDLSVFFIGTGGSTPSAARGLPAMLLRRGGDRVLFDCGEGTQRQLVRSIGLLEIDAVFLTHFHADHWLGLPGMLKTFALRERQRPLVVFGPEGLTELMRSARFMFGKLPFELSFRELEPFEEVRCDGYSIGAVPVRHRGSAFGYAVVEQPRPGHFDPERARQLGISEGPDFGRLQRGESVNGVAPEQVVGAPRDGRTIVLSGDTGPCETLAVSAHHADLLIHEATFLAEDGARAQETSHSTAAQAARLAAEAEVKMLALTHISGRYPPRLVRAEAREIFANSWTPRDFDSILLPFPERGEPQLSAWPKEGAGSAERQKAELAGC